MEHAYAMNGGIPQPEGPFYPERPPLGGVREPVRESVREPEPVGFDAGDVWTFPYNLNPYIDARGEVPPPTQARLDDFNRSMAKLMIDYENALKESEDAQRRAETEAEEKRKRGEAVEPTVVTMESVEEALAEKAQAVSKVKDAVAKLCHGHPTRKQLEALPEYVFMRFAHVLGRKVNPEV